MANLANNAAGVPGALPLLLLLLFLASCHAGLPPEKLVSTPEKRCPASAIPASVRCVAATEGRVGEARVCVCALDCLHVTLQCGAAATWAFSGHPASFCDASRRTYQQQALHVTVENGTHTFRCTPGLRLVGNSSAACVDGKMSAPQPSCTQENSTSPQNTSSKQNTAAAGPKSPVTDVAIGIGSSLVVVALVVGAYCGVQHWRRHRERTAFSVAGSGGGRGANPAPYDLHDLPPDHVTMGELYVSFNTEFNNVRANKPAE